MQILINSTQICFSSFFNKNRASFNVKITIVHLEQKIKVYNVGVIVVDRRLLFVFLRMNISLVLN